MLENFNLIAETNTETVATSYTPAQNRETDYQSEADLENAFIDQLCGNFGQNKVGQGYEYINITSEPELIQNLRKQIEKLNRQTRNEPDFKFSDIEWKRFFDKIIANQTADIVKKTENIQEQGRFNFKFDNGQEKNVYIIDKENIHNNSLQVINQYEIGEESGASRKNRLACVPRASRYDVTILVNGLPLVHIELKRRGVELREAFNQIKRYNRDSFWAGSGLFEYIQIFVISNGTNTKYYSNTTRDAHIREMWGGEKKARRQKTSDSFEFTSYWATADNKPLRDLTDFTATFFSKHTLLNILTKYCVFDESRKLLVMRPYQIVATERILNRILTSTNAKQLGTLAAGGYIWHTTGSGKTLTSFKTAQLASKLEYVDKVLFVVDRKDLDYQTMREYDRFEKGAASSSNSTKHLKKNLEDDNKRIIITTIQKLDRFIGKHEKQKHEIFDKHAVLIFDECHRGQFGDTHKRITKYFKNYNIFGFTGTPIFATNASMASKHFDLTTTEQAFGDKLHIYTIVDAINDKNVLPFKVDYVKTVTPKEDLEDEKVKAIDSEAVLMADSRIKKVTEYILENFDHKTSRNECYELREKRMRGFNSIFAVQSISMAKKYYEEFRWQQTGLELQNRLKVATIFSFAANEELKDDLSACDAQADQSGLIPDEEFDEKDLSRLDQSSADFLQNAMEDYNQMFQTNFTISGDGFQNYYKDVSQRVKEREIDILIVVGMFLTGFDATTLNTLWVDKNLQYHGLLQAFSRTNRILNSVKQHGNIVCFRNLEKKTEEAISLFGNKEAAGIVLLKTFDEYYNGFTDENGKRIKGYEEIIADLVQKYPLGQEIIGEEAEKDFIKAYGNILKLRNILSSFDEFSDDREDGNKMQILGDRDFQDYQSRYLDLYNEWRPKLEEAVNVNPDIVFEIELIKQVEINIDYILMLVVKYFKTNQQDKDILVSINKAIDSSLQLRSKKDLIEAFINRINPSASSVNDDWQEYIKAIRKKELQNIINEEKLKNDNLETEKFIENAFENGFINENGTAIMQILPPAHPFAPDSADKKHQIIAKLQAFLERFRSIS